MVSSPQGPIATGIGAGGGSAAATIPVEEGGEYAFSFSFYVQPAAYRVPGVDNPIVQFQGEAGELPSFGLQLWDDGTDGGRGLWSSGDAMGGERLLAPLEEGLWHEAVVYFQASSDRDGFYLVFLDGKPIEARAGVSLIDPGSASSQVEVGPLRDDESVDGTPEVLFGEIRLGDTLESVLP